MSVSLATLNRLRRGLGNRAAADEIDQLLGFSAGTTYYVDSGHTNAADSTINAGTSPDQPFATLDYAFGRVTASNGDVIVLMPGHAETTSAIAWDVAGVKVIGLGYGRNRPTLTVSATAADLISVSAANGQLWNVRLVGTTASATALLNGTSAATDFECHECEFALAATPTSPVTWSGARLIIEDLTVTQSANGADYIVTFEAGVDGFQFKRWTVICPNGLDNGLINSGAFAHVGYLVDDIRVVGLDTLVVNFLSSIGTVDGLISNVHATYSAAVTSIEDGVAAASSVGVGYSEIYVSDATGKRTGRVPLTSAS